MKEGIAVEGRIIIKPLLLQGQILEQLHSNHMDIEMMQLFEGVSMLGEYICRHENTIKQCAICLEYQ